MKTSTLNPMFRIEVLVFLCALVSCEKDLSEETQDEKPVAGQVPDYFPPLPVPDENPLTADKISLGEKLFFNPILSRDSSISCGTCHQPKNAFSDNLPKSLGIDNLENLRNAPSLFNVAYHPALFWDGGNPELESQVVGPIEAHNEMDLNYVLATRRVAENLEYVELFQKVFNETPNTRNLAQAIASYERSLLSFDSSFDRYFYKNQNDAISEKAKVGYELFASAKLNCTACHAPPLFTDISFQNNGSQSDYGNDRGRMRITQDDRDEGKFKVPSLRNVSLTAPYMHNGDYETLGKVINNYAAGGTAHFNQSGEIRGFSLSDEEKGQLIAFLESLVDTGSYKFR